MLCRSIAQPVRHFEPAAVAHPAGAAARTICDLCAKEVFNKAPFRSLQATTEDAVAPSSPRPQYSRVARSVHEAMLAGCRWCTVIGNAVLTSSELNYWASRWEGSRSDGESMSGDSEEEEESSGDEGGDVEEHDVDIEDACDNDHERPGFLTIRALDCAATLEVAIEFLRWGSSEVFNLAKVAIEVRTSSDDEDCALQEMVGDNAISMTLEVISTGTEDSRTSAILPGPY